MATYAHVTNGTVDKVIEADADVIATGDFGPPEEWFETSSGTSFGVNPNGPAIRGNYAGIGHTYVAGSDIFVTPVPFYTWSIDPALFKFVAPVAEPQPIPNYLNVWSDMSMEWTQSLMPEGPLRWVFFATFTYQQLGMPIPIYVQSTCNGSPSPTQQISLQSPTATLEGHSDMAQPAHIAGSNVWSVSSMQQFDLLPKTFLTASTQGSGSPAKYSVAWGLRAYNLMPGSTDYDFLQQWNFPSASGVTSTSHVWSVNEP